MSLLNKKEMAEESARIIKTAFIRDAKVSPTMKRSLIMDVFAEDFIDCLKGKNTFTYAMSDCEYEKCGTEGKELALSFGVSTVYIRKVVEYIRIFNDDLLPGEFIIANKHGYLITDDEALITKHFNKTHSRYKNTSAQVMQMAKIFPKLLGGM